MEYRPLWYKSAVIYAVDVDVYVDSDGDGIGDFQGLNSRLDYIATLGVDCLWLLPFYPSPNRDNGYDITDYFAIDRTLGTLGDFARFMREADARGIRVILDLVVGHTSNQHPWFQQARRDPQSPFRDFYVWSKIPPPSEAEQVVYERHEQKRGLWTYDEVAGAYYRHRFYDFEPDLNLVNPAVQAKVHDIMRYWLTFGIAGFRIDAAKYFGGPPVPPGAPTPGPHGILKAMYAAAAEVRPDVVLIGELDAEPRDMEAYFAGGKELQMQQNFYLGDYLFLALAEERAQPLVYYHETLPPAPPAAQWMNFVRNYDELDLDMLSEHERQTVYRAFAPDPSMRIYERGIRRRFPPMVHGDLTRQELAYSLLFTLPGAPMLLYGEEIGMGDDLRLPGRWAVRTPMQWAPLPNGGFSEAPADQLARPVIDQGPFAYQTVNVADQRRDPHSLLSWMTRAIAVRRDAPELSWGKLCFVETGEPSVLAFTRDWQGNALLVLHNLCGRPCTVRIDPARLPDHPLLELLNDQPYPTVTSAQDHFDLGPYGHRWFRFGRQPCVDVRAIEAMHAGGPASPSDGSPARSAAGG